MRKNIFAAKIKRILGDNEILSQREISNKMPSVDRAILTGYLRCLVDLGEIKSKDLGRSKIYFIGGTLKGINKK